MKKMNMRNIKAYHDPDAPKAKRRKTKTTE